MARASFTDVQAVSKSLLTRNDYLLNFGVVPGSGLTQSKETLLKCVHVSLPPIEIEPLVVDMHGFQIMHRGRKKFGNHSFDCTFYVSGDTSLLGYNADAYQLFYNWMNKISDTETGQGQSGQSLLFSGLQGMAQGAAGKMANKVLGKFIPKIINNTKKAYSVENVTLNVYNVKGDLTLKASLKGVFPLVLEGLDLSNNQTNKELMAIKATFALDSYEIADILTTKALDFVNKKLDKIAKRVSKKIPPTVKKYSRLV